MGKKDAQGQKAVPVDNYRKQIGKHDYMKERKKLKSSKAAADLRKSATPMQDVLKMVTAGLVLVVGLYFGLYWYLDKHEH